MKKYKTDYSEEELHNALNDHKGEAKELIEDITKWEKFKKKFEAFLKKAEKIPVLGGVIDDVVCMVSLVDSYIKKEYRDIFLGTIISITAALIYVVNPIDLIPDVIPVLGYIDDTMIITLVLGFGVSKDLKKYREWHEEKRKEAIDKLKRGIASELAETIKENYIVGVVISDEKLLKLLIAKDDTMRYPIECTIKTKHIPIEVLSDYDIIELNEILELFESVLNDDSIKWAKNVERCVYYEPDFSDKWDNYAIQEDD